MFCHLCHLSQHWQNIYCLQFESDKLFGSELLEALQFRSLFLPYAMLTNINQFVQEILVFLWYTVDPELTLDHCLLTHMNIHCIHHAVKGCREKLRKQMKNGTWEGGNVINHMDGFPYTPLLFSVHFHSSLEIMARPDSVCACVFLGLREFESGIRTSHWLSLIVLYVRLLAKQ